jgi:hypothetical protein
LIISKEPDRNVAVTGSHIKLLALRPSSDKLMMNNKDKDKDKDKKENKIGLIKEVLLSIFSVPAAIGVIDKLDDRLKLQEHLEKAVLNYRTISNDFWFFVEKVIGIDIPFKTEALTFILLLLLPALIGVITADRSKWNYSKQIDGYSFKKATRDVWKFRNQRDNQWTILSIIAIFFYGFILNVFYYLFVYFYLSLVVIFGMWFMFTIVRVLKIAFLIIIGRFASGIQQLKNDIELYFYLILVFIIIVLLTQLDMINSNKISSVYDMFFGAILAIAIFFGSYATLRMRLRTPAYTLLWASGIFIINWAATTLSPAIDLYFNNIGM